MIQLTRFEIFDITLIVILLAITLFFLYKNKKKLGREGILFLYRTRWGIKIIDKIGKKYKKTLKVLSYISIFIGYILMVSIVYFFTKVIWGYLFNPEVAEMMGGAPPIAPLIPYFPRLFGLSDFFPAFSGIYFIAALLIVMVAHEFSHGIFARRYNVKIKSTGFAFLWIIFTGVFMVLFKPIKKIVKNEKKSKIISILACILILILSFLIHPVISIILIFPILGAFVEQDEKDMQKVGKFEQMSILSAGVFANLIVGFIFLIILIFWFSIAFIPSGVMFQGYSYFPVEVKNIESINEIETWEGMSYEEFINIIDGFDEGELIRFKTNERNYVSTPFILKQKKEFFNAGYLILYDDAPAINAGLRGYITHINGEKINGRQKIGDVLLKYKPGEEINIKTFYNESEIKYTIILAENPLDKEKAYLGVSFLKEEGFFKSEFIHFISSLRKINLPVKGAVYHTERWTEASVWFYYLLWWIVFINLLVALFNMLPVGIFDGGRFFYLTILGITKNEKLANKLFSIMTYLFLFLLAVITIKWLLIR